MKTLSIAQARHLAANGTRFQSANGKPLDVAALSPKLPPGARLAAFFNQIIATLTNLVAVQARGADAATALAAQLEKQVPPTINVKATAPERAAHVRWTFEIKRDAVGRLQQIVAIPNNQKE